MAQPIRINLSNGLVLIVVENPVADIIAGRIFVKVGSLYEPLDHLGLTHLLSTVITKGTQQLNSWEIAEKIESVGASLGTESTSDYFLLSLKTVSSDFPDILAIAGEILRNPTFPEEEVSLEKSLVIYDIKSQKEQPMSLAFTKLREIMYPNHPYGYSSLGIEETLENLTPDKLLHHHQTYFRPDNIIISLAGRITVAEAIAQVEQVFGNWESPLTPLPKITPNPINSQPNYIFTPQATHQTIIMLSYLTPGVIDPNYPTLKLLSTYLGNGLSSRLFVEMREKRGLAYDVSSMYPTRIGLSPFTLYIGTAPQNSEIALTGLKSEVDRLSQDQLSPLELQTAKNKLLGQYALGKQTNGQLAQTYGWYETLSLGIEFDQTFQSAINTITPEQLKSVALDYMTQPYISIVGPDH